MTGVKGENPEELGAMRKLKRTKGSEEVLLTSHNSGFRSSMEKFNKTHLR